MSRKHYDVLDSFRGLAAIFVAIFHLKVVGMVFEFNLIKNSYYFVEFFFVLSGFVMAHSYGNQKPCLSFAKTFIVKRIFRIYPLHFFMLCLFIPFAVANSYLGVDLGPRFSIEAFIANLLLAHALGFFEVSTWNLPSWSISVEFYTYLLFLFLVLVKKNDIRTYFVLSVVSLIILFLFSSMGDTSRYAFFRCTYSFFLGCIAYRYSNNFKSTNIIEIMVTFCTLALLCYDVIDSNSWVAFCLPLCFFCVVLVFSKQAGMISKFLDNRFLMFLGKISFSIYLTHTLWISLFKGILLVAGKYYSLNFIVTLEGRRVIDLGLGSFNDIIYLPYLVLVILTSYITYVHIEKRFKYPFGFSKKGLPLSSTRNQS
ncbi:acyltransferase family protein [Vibrio cyclitrophicus]